MRCRSVRDKLDRYCSQELPARLLARMEAHLQDCVDCRRQLARQGRLDVVLRSVPEPPAVPAGFAERLASAMRERQVVRRSVPASLERRRWMSPSGSVGRQVTQAAVCVAGLLIGILMAQQTWQSVHPVDSQFAHQLNRDAVQELDYLMDIRGDSLAESYLALTTTTSRSGT